MHDCIRYSGPIQSNGYGSGSPHVRAYVKANGPVPDGCEIHHTCEVPTCINHRHLVAKNVSEHRSEHSRGGRNACAKLTDLDAIDIWDLHHSGVWKRHELADAFGVSQTTIQRIISGNGWKHLKLGPSRSR